MAEDLQLADSNAILIPKSVVIPFPTAPSQFKALYKETQSSFLMLVSTVLIGVLAIPIMYSGTSG